MILSVVPTVIVTLFLPPDSFFPTDPPQFYQTPFSCNRIDPIKEALIAAGFTDINIAVLAREQEEGPPEVSTRMHSCGKMKYATMGNVLSDFGVDLTQTGTTTAGYLYTSGSGALGQPDYSNRIAEAATLSTSGAVRFYDVLVAAAPTVISNMPNVARCAIAGTATSMFDASGNCTSAGVSCLTGAPATQAQVDLCTSAVQSNSSDMVGSGNSQVTVGQVVAVASLLSAAHTCE